MKNKLVFVLVLSYMSLYAQSNELGRSIPGASASSVVTSETGTAQNKNAYNRPFVFVTPETSGSKLTPLNNKFSKKQSPRFSDNEKTFALVVGVSNYLDPNFPDLKYAHRDAEAFATFLQSKPGGEIPRENIRILTDATATGARFNTELDWLAESAMEADKIIIYLAGYGDTHTTGKEAPSYFFLSDSPVTPLWAGAFEMKQIASFLESTTHRKEPDYLLVANFYPLRSNRPIVENIKRKSLFKNAFNLNLTSPEDYLPKKVTVELPTPGKGKITNNHLLLDGLLGLADRNKNQKVSFKELKKYLKNQKPNKARLPGLLFLSVGKRYDPLVLVDTMILKKLVHHNDDLFPSIIHLETGLKEDRILKTVAEEIQLSYQDFVVAVKLGNLLFPDGKSADDIYRRLIQKPELIELHGDMRRKLAAALQDEVQQALNAYLKLDNRELERRNNDIDAYINYRNYLSRSIELFGSKSFMTRIMRAKLYYFTGLVYRMESVRDSKPELLDGAAQSQRAALDLATDASFIYNELGVVYSLQNEWNKAIKNFEKAKEYSPTWGIPFSNLCISYAAIGDYEKSIYAGLNAYQRSPKNIYVTNTLASVYLRSGNYYGAEKLYQIVLEKDPQNMPALYDMACIRSLTGQKEAAFDYLHQALQNGFNDLNHMRVDPDLDNIRGDKKFEELVKQFFEK